MFVFGLVGLMLYSYRWKTLFFSIKGFDLYCYKYHNTQKSESKIPLHLLESCDNCTETEFSVALKDGRHMRLRAKNETEAKKWTDAINAVNARALMQSKNDADSLIMLYKDVNEKFPL